MYINVKEYKNKLYITELNQDYKLTFKVQNDFKSELFVETPFESEYKSLIDNKPLQKIEFDSIREYKEYKWKMKETENGSVYADIPTEYQFIRKYYRNAPQFKPRFWFLDIETDVPDKGFPNPFETPTPVTLIQFTENDTNYKYVIGCNEYTPDEDEIYIHAEDEKDLFNKFSEMLFKRTPSITVAWNGDGFDYIYLVNRAKKIGLDPAKLFSPFGILEEHTTFVFGKQIKIEKPLGFIWLDEIECYKKGDPSGKESWSLEYMSKYVLGEEEGGKLNYKKAGYLTMRDFITNKYNPELDTNPESKMKRLYYMIQKNPDNAQYKSIFNKLHWRTFVKYGIIDAEVLKAIEVKKGNLDAIVDLAQTMQVNINDVFATVKPWQIHIWNELYDRKQFVPAKSPFDTYKIPGGYVYANQGLHKWVCSFDVRSLYPFCMISLNMSPETYVRPENVPKELSDAVKPFWRYNKEVDGAPVFSEDIFLQMLPDEKEKIKKLLIKYDLCMAPNGTFYTRDKQGIIPELVQDIYTSRKYYKKMKKDTEKELEVIKKEIKKRGLKVY